MRGLVNLTILSSAMQDKNTFRERAFEAIQLKELMCC